MKPNEVIEMLEDESTQARMKLGFYVATDCTRNQSIKMKNREVLDGYAEWIEALQEAIKCVELMPQMIKYIEDSAGLYICDCKCCDEFRNRKDELLRKAKGEAK